jgi:hypothetical protein
MRNKLKVHCKECIYRTGRTLENGIILGHCHLKNEDKHGFETCEDGKHINEESLRFEAEQVDFE